MGCDIKLINAQNHVLGSHDFCPNYRNVYILDILENVAAFKCAFYPQQSTFDVLGAIMWYFAWILGVLLAVSFGIINVMWLELEEDMDTFH